MKSLIREIITPDLYNKIREFHRISSAKLVEYTENSNQNMSVSNYPSDLSSKAYDRFSDSEYIPNHKRDNTSSIRYSVRRFSNQLDWDIFTKLIDALGNFEFKNEIKRPYPSAGALYPCHIYAAITSTDLKINGVHYLDQENRKLIHCFNDFCANDVIYEAENFNAPLYIIITADLPRSTSKYGARGYRFSLLEAGIIGSSIERTVRKFGYATLWIGGFDDEKLAESIGINPQIEEEYPLIVIAIGKEEK